MSQQPIVFVSHGGGPMPVLGHPSHADLIRVFAQIRTQLATITPKPQALLFISAHWEAAPLAITSAAQPELYYDYHGFPAESYQLRYPVAGAPAVAQQVQQALSKAGIEADLQATRGLDHGVFVPAMLIWPEATIPTLQLSLHPSLDADLHLRIGAALAPLSEAGVMIVASGYSFHNMRAFFDDAEGRGNAANQAFEQWLEHSLQDADPVTALRAWQHAPGARYCHPREEHLLPLLVAAAAAARQGYPAPQSWRFDALGKQGSCYLWQASGAGCSAKR